MLNRFDIRILLLMTVSTASFGASQYVDYMEGHLNTQNFKDSTFRNVDGHIGGVSNQASEKVGNVPGNRYNFDLEIDANHNVDNVKNQNLEGRFHVAALNNDQGLTMYSLQEAYVGLHPSEDDHIRVGRMILPWSTVDSVWGFGKLNNRRNFNYFTPGQEGLIGFLYEVKPKTGFRMRLFGSPIYVPEMNPGLDINKKDKSISSRHPWADVPASRADVEGRMMDVKYDVNYPEVTDVIYRGSGGANLGWETKHWIADAFYMRKPENTTTPDVEINVDWVNEVVNAEIDPRFYYHDVIGSSLRYRNRDVEMYVSGITIRPNEYPDVQDSVRYTEIKSKKRKEDYVGGGISRSNDLYTIAFNYVARLSPFDRTKDDLSLDPRWNQAVNFVLGRNFGMRYSVVADVKFDMLTRDRLIMVRGNYNVTKNFFMNVGVNMIGTPENGKSFWSPYTNNDAVYGGLRYVF